jgi:hypothetical protein
LREVEDLSDVCLIDLAEVSCSGRLCQRTPLGASCLEIAESDQIWFLCFYLAVWFQRECREALLDVTILWCNFSFHSEVT